MHLEREGEMNMLSCLFGFFGCFFVVVVVFLFAYKQGTVIGPRFPDGKILLLAAPITKAPVNKVLCCLFCK